MLLNPIVAMLYNTKLNRYHPIYFEEKPLPGPSSPDKPVRHKSKMHHTTGFESREKALQSIEDDLQDPAKLEYLRGTKKCLDKDIPWDGEGIPAMVCFFSEDGTQLLM